MDKEQEKKIIEFAEKATASILAECNPEEQGIIISSIMANIHNEYRSKIAEITNNLESRSADYDSFLEHTSLPNIKNSESK